MLSKMIFGCGTGRCGTWTLSQILAAQADVAASHEGFLLPWQVDAAQLWHKLLRAQAHCKAPVWANASFVWMRYAGKVLSMIEDPKFICLRRDRQQVIDSFLQHTPTLNHWTNPASAHWRPGDTHTIQSIAWPKYDAPKADAIGRYYDAYYGQAQYLQRRYPDNFAIFSMHAALNTEAGQRAMLSFAGIKNPQIHLHQKLNALGKPKGQIVEVTTDVHPR